MKRPARRGLLLAGAMLGAVVMLVLFDASDVRLQGVVRRTLAVIAQDDASLALDTLEQFARHEAAAGRSPAGLELPIPGWGRGTVTVDPAGWRLTVTPAATSPALSRVVAP